MSGRVLASIAGCVVGFAGAASAYQWETAYFTQDLDHFNFENSSTFQEKYLVSAASWKAGGPIFFYTGARRWRKCISLWAVAAAAAAACRARREPDT